ncbi:LTA synthase family protein [Fictibacillus enclensis]|uniref:LTA synthase family protein n=1 Tax=Fictibacillus enclensis TaxID=1017270 RepID=UPI0025A0F30B|nr:LTA synthase family protein [Fictibacillus enclensis]MDM5200104.1 LTA synthase family protein [Fictibacillus enclensis]
MMNKLEQQTNIQNSTKRSLSFFLLAVILLWVKSYIAFRVGLNLDLENVMQEIILVVTPLSSALFFLGLSLFAPAKSRNKALLTIHFIMSFILYANIVYHRFFDDFITIPVLFQFKNFGDLGGSAQSLMHPLDILYFLDFLLLLTIVLTKKVKPVEKLKKKTIGLVFISAFSIFLANLGMAEIQRPELLTRTFDRAILVKLMGVYNYHVYDAVLNTKSSTQRALADSNDLAEVKNYSDSQYKKPDPKMFGAAKGKNVILVSMESTQNFLINKKINGQEVTPFLNDLTEKSYYFDNFYHNTGQGKTSDAEFLIDNSLYGLPGGSVYSTKAQNKFHATPEIVKQKGYNPVVFHANNKSFWNRDMMYNTLGYNKFYSKPYYNVNDENSVNYGLKDKEFFKQSMPMLENLKQPFYSKFITLTNHHPFILNNEQEKSIQPADTGDPTVDNYFVTARYQDEALKQFFQQLKASGLYDNSVIILYGDHYGISENHNKAMSKILGKEVTPYEHLKLQETPLFIHVPGQKGKVMHTIGGEIDLKPTILHLLGIKTKGDIQFGSDLFSPDRDEFTVQRDGSAITKDYVYAGEKEKCYRQSDGQEVANKLCKPAKEKAAKDLNLSDKVVYGDLLRFFKDGKIVNQQESNK